MDCGSFTELLMFYVALKNISFIKKTKKNHGSTKKVQLAISTPLLNYQADAARYAAKSYIKFSYMLLITSLHLAENLKKQLYIFLVVIY